MSQEKVERYKADKANRKEILKKQKRKSLIAKSLASVLGLVIVFWIGYSGYTMILANIPRKSTEVDVQALNDYLTSLTAEDDEDEVDDAADDVADEEDAGAADEGEEAADEDDGNAETDNQDDSENGTTE